MSSYYKIAKWWINQASLETKASHEYCAVKAAEYMVKSYLNNEL